MERHSPGTTWPAGVLSFENRSEHFAQNLLENGSSHYTITLEEIEACIAAPNTVEVEIEARELACIIENFWTRWLPKTALSLCAAIGFLIATRI